MYIYRNIKSAFTTEPLNGCLRNLVEEQDKSSDIEQQSALRRPQIRQHTALNEVGPQRDKNQREHLKILQSI